MAAARSTRAMSLRRRPTSSAGPERDGKRPSTCVVQYKTDRSGNVQTAWADKWCAPHAQPSPTAVQGVVCARTQCSVALQTLPVLVQFWDAD